MVFLLPNRQQQYEQERRDRELALRLSEEDASKVEEVQRPAAYVLFLTVYHLTVLDILSTYKLSSFVVLVKQTIRNTKELKV